MPDEALLRARALHAIQQGKLPVRPPDRTWGGPGVGALCTICDRPVGTEEMGFEIGFAHDGDGSGLDKFPVHMRCFAAWEFEREGGSAPRGSRNGGPAVTCLLPTYVVEAMESDGLRVTRIDLVPVETRSITVQCEPEMAAWCRTRAATADDGDIDYARLLVTLAHTMETVLGLR